MTVLLRPTTYKVVPIKKYVCTCQLLVDKNRLCSQPNLSTYLRLKEQRPIWRLRHQSVRFIRNSDKDITKGKTRDEM